MRQYAVGLYHRKGPIERAGSVVWYVFLEKLGARSPLLRSGKFTELAAEKGQRLAFIRVVALDLTHNDHVITTLMMHNAPALKMCQTTIHQRCATQAFFVLDSAELVTPDLAKDMHSSPWFSFRICT
jgi:hypothetical protein